MKNKIMIKKIMKVMKIKMRKIILMKIRMEIYQFKLINIDQKKNEEDLKIELN